MRLTLRYDGTPRSAQIVDAETGEPLQDVRSYVLRHEARGYDVLELQLFVRNPATNQEHLVPELSNSES